MHSASSFTKTVRSGALPLIGLMFSLGCAPATDPVPAGASADAANPSGPPDAASRGSLPDALNSDSDAGAGPTGGTPAPGPTGTGSTSPTSAVGAQPSIAGCPVFPADNAWNRDISAAPVHALSAGYIASMGSGTALHPDWSSTSQNGGNGYGIPITLVPGTQPKVPITFVDYPSEADPGPYPIPSNVAIEGPPGATSGDRHGIILDQASCYLYEVYILAKSSAGFQGSVGAIWHLKENWSRPRGWTSADAAGLPILPGLVRYEEVAAGEIRHALRFTAALTQRGFIAPASHFASSSTDANRPPMGLRVRLKASVDISGYPARMQVILRALKKYGMFMADNGSNWFLTGAPDSRWDDNEIATLKALHGSDFEAVDTGPVQQ